MTYPEATAIIGGALVVVVGAIVALVRIFGNRNGHSKAANPDTIYPLIEAIRDQSSLLRDIRDGVISMRSDLRMQALEQGHLQKSVEALHSRFDAAVGRASQ